MRGKIEKEKKEKKKLTAFPKMPQKVIRYCLVPSSHRMRLDNGSPECSSPVKWRHDQTGSPAGALDGEDMH